MLLGKHMKPFHQKDKNNKFVKGFLGKISSIEKVELKELRKSKEE
jgi:hypothetical protein